MANDPAYDMPPPKKSNTLLWVLIGIFGGLTVFCCLPCGGCGFYFWYANKVNEDKIAADPGIAITADDLSKNYSDAAYMGKVLVVTGKVNSQGVMGLDMGSGPNKVLCTQSSSEAAAFQNVKAGQIVTVKGLCGGKPSGTIMVTNCHLK